LKKTTVLRKLLEKPGVIIVPPAYDCLSARVVEATGFKAALMAAGLTGDAQLGVPNFGLATASEIINCAKYIAHSVNIPLIVGIEDGWGGALASYRTVQEVIRAGAAAIYINDQKHRKLIRAPHNLVDVLPRDEFLGKMGAVLEARNKEDKDFIIIARIDAGATMGDAEVIARAKACIKLGVDIILPHALPPESKYPRKDKAGLTKLYKAIGAPEAKIWCNGLKNITAKDCADMGAKISVPDDSPTVPVKNLLANVYRDMYTTLCGAPDKGMSGRGQKNMPGDKEFWKEIENKYEP
jgi:2-methylisocitrate lyase-like PEP mutase family enzyme